MDIKRLSKEMLSLSYILDNFNISDIDYGKFIYSILKYCYEKNIMTTIYSENPRIKNYLNLAFEYSGYDKTFMFGYKTSSDTRCSYKVSHIVFATDVQMWSDETYCINLNIYSNMMLKRCCLNDNFLKIKRAIFRLLHSINYLNEYNTSKEYVNLTYDISKYEGRKFPRDKYMKQPVIEVVGS